MIRIEFIFTNHNQELKVDATLNLQNGENENGWVDRTPVTLFLICAKKLDDREGRVKSV